MSMRTGDDGTVVFTRSGVGALWRRWRRIAEAIGVVQTRLLLEAFYFLIFPPFAVVLRLSRDPLRINTRRGQSQWLPHASREPRLEEWRKQS